MSAPIIPKQVQGVLDELVTWGVFSGSEEHRQRLAWMVYRALGETAQEDLYDYALQLQEEVPKNLPAVIAKRLTSEERIQDEIRLSKLAADRAADKAEQVGGKVLQMPAPRPGAALMVHPGTPEYEQKQNVGKSEEGIEARRKRMAEDRLAYKCWHGERGYTPQDDFKDIAHQFSTQEHHRARCFGAGEAEVRFFSPTQIEEMLERGLSRMCPLDEKDRPLCLRDKKPAVSMARWMAQRKAVQTGKKRRKAKWSKEVGEVDNGPSKVELDRWRRVQVKALSESTGFEEAAREIARVEGWSPEALLERFGRKV